MTRTLAICDDYSGLVAALRARVDELGIAIGSDNAAQISGLPQAYLAKLMTPRVSGKHFGLVSLGPVLGLLGVKLHIVEDERQTRKMQARIEKRNPNYVRDGDVHFAINRKDFKEMGKKGGANSRKRMSSEKASSLGRRAAKHRHYGEAAIKRSLNARTAALARWRKYREGKANESAQSLKARPRKTD